MSCPEYSADFKLDINFAFFKGDAGGLENQFYSLVLCGEKLAAGDIVLRPWV